MQPFFKYYKGERRRCYDKLREMLPEGGVVYTIYRHRSYRGTMHCISCLVAKDSEIVDISYFVARGLGLRIHPEKSGVVIRGGGMDMGFHLVDTLARFVHGDGKKLTRRWL